MAYSSSSPFPTTSSWMARTSFLVQFDGVDEPKWQSPVGDTGTGIRSTNVFKEYVRAHSLDLRAPTAARSTRSA